MMGWGTGNLGGGSAGLNFKVVGGTSQPSSPSENTIWINTDVPVSGYIFSATEPEETIEGVVWISTRTQSDVEFNALKKGTIQVYPVLAKQHVSGAWVDVTAKSYQNGAWVDWWDRCSLYDEGNEFEAGTGGWIVGCPIIFGSSFTTVGNIDVTKGSTLIAKQTVYLGNSVLYMQNRIDLTDFSTLNFQGSMDGLSSYCYLGIWTEFGIYQEDNRVAMLTATVQDGVHTIDISALQGKHRIGFFIFSDGSGITMQKMWLS